MAADADRALCDFGSALEARRVRKGLTLAQLAAKGGISMRGLRFRLLRCDPKWSTLTRAAEGLGCDVEIRLVERRPE